MMSNTPPKPLNWIVEEKVNKELLRSLALQLEKELAACIHLSKDVSDFASNAGVLSVIDRAKKMEIENAEEIGGMRHWLFETDVGDYLNPSLRAMQNALAKFQHALKCWRLEE